MGFRQVGSPPVDFSWNPQYEPDFLWFDQSLVDAARKPDNGTENIVLTFFELLALCHTIMPSWKNGEFFCIKSLFMRTRRKHIVFRYGQMFCILPTRFYKSNIQMVTFLTSLSFEYTYFFMVSNKVIEVNLYHFRSRNELFKMLYDIV